LFIRIIISWFGGIPESRPVDLLVRVTDPYLDWWRSRLNLRVGFFDFSAVFAIVAVSLVQNIFNSLANSAVLKLGNILAVVLLSLWSIVSFILGLLLIILILRLIAYLTNRNTYSPFWRLIESISQPVLYRLNRIIFGKRIAGFLKGIILSSLLLAALMAGGHFAVRLIAALLTRLPV
jgi:YggT family protein